MIRSILSIIIGKFIDIFLRLALLNILSRCDTSNGGFSFRNVPKRKHVQLVSGMCASGVFGRTTCAVRFRWSKADELAWTQYHLSSAAHWGFSAIEDFEFQSKFQTRGRRTLSTDWCCGWCENSGRFCMKGCGNLWFMSKIFFKNFWLI